MLHTYILINICRKYVLIFDMQFVAPYNVFMFWYNVNIQNMFLFIKLSICINKMCVFCIFVISINMVLILFCLTNMYDILKKQKIGIIISSWIVDKQKTYQKVMYVFWEQYFWKCIFYVQQNVLSVNITNMYNF